MTDLKAQEAFCRVLNDRHPGWTVTADGITGPERARVRLLQMHEAQSPGHVDVQFVLDDRAKPAIELWDCVVGFGDTDEARAQCAAKIWGQTTAGVWLELKYSGQGKFADHYHGADPGGFTGWHAIAGAIIGYGSGHSPGVLQDWWLAHPVLPALAAALNGSLVDEKCPYGIKIFFGGVDVAEVRVNGEPHEAASAALAALPWPRLDPPAFVRSYVVVLYLDDSANG
jgi:hypothetical protein